MRSTVSFKLLADDVGWPPYASETMPVEKETAGLRILVPPLFVKNLSVGDVVSGELGNDACIHKFTHVAMSQHSTIWIMPKGSPLWESIQSELLGVGCIVVPFRQLGFFSIDLPPDTPLEKFDEIVSPLVDEGGEVAYPSLRHRENSILASPS